MYDNLAELNAAAEQEHRDLAGLLTELGLDPAAGTIWVPLLAGDVHDLAGLSTIRSLLFD